MTDLLVTEILAVLLGILVFGYAMLGAVANSGFVTSRTLRDVELRSLVLAGVVEGWALDDDVSLHDLEAAARARGAEPGTVVALHQVFRGSVANGSLRRQVGFQRSLDESFLRLASDDTQAGDESSTALLARRGEIEDAARDELRQACGGRCDPATLLEVGAALLGEDSVGLLRAVARDVRDAPRHLAGFVGASLDRLGRGVTIGLLGACIWEAVDDAVSDFDSFGVSITWGTLAGVTAVLVLDLLRMARAVVVHPGRDGESRRDLVEFAVLLITPALVVAGAFVMLVR